MQARSYNMCVLQVKYDELLRRCQQTDGLSHKGVQTSSTPVANSRTRRRLSSSATLSDLTVVSEDGQQQPEYKVLFKEIFTCIQKTKDDLSDNRRPVRDSDSQDSAQ